MPYDRNKNRLTVGDPVTIIPGMAVRAYETHDPMTKGTISSINGSYIYVALTDSTGYTFDVERYGSELWKGHDDDTCKDF